MARKTGKQEKAGEQEAWETVVCGNSVPEQPLGQRLCGHMMGDHAPNSNRFLLTATILTSLHVSCLLLCLPRTFAHAVLLPEGLSLTCSDDSSFASFRPLLSSQFKRPWWTAVWVLLCYPVSLSVLFYSLALFIHLFILSLSLSVGWKFEQAGDLVHRSRLTFSTG